MLILLKILFVLVLVGGGVMTGYFVYFNSVIRERSDSEKKLTLPIMLFLFGLVMTVLFSAAVQISPTQVGVVTNTWTGELYSLDSGTHIWPFSKSVVPLITKVTVYSTMQRFIEIGSTPAAEGGVAASSGSPGQPVVFFAARGWATINKESILELHKKYGEDYLTSWVESVWITTLKQVQGKNLYDYVASQRLDMETTVEKELQLQLLASDGVTPLVIVSQLAIVDFDYDEKVNAFLNTVSDMQFQTQQAKQQTNINTEKQKAEVIAAETNYLVTKRAAEAAQVKNVTEAQGLADAVKLAADAEAYKIAAEAEAQAQAIAVVQKNLTPMYNDYLRALGWDGAYPKYWLGGGTLPVLSIPVEPQ